MGRALPQRRAIRDRLQQTPVDRRVASVGRRRPVSTGIEQLARAAARRSAALSKSRSTRCSARDADTATARNSGPAANPGSESGLRRAMTSSKRKPRSITGRPRSARDGSMKARHAESSKLAAHSEA